jgi:hypothetical protein
MPRLYGAALGVADALRGLQDVHVTPDPPHTTAMHVVLPADRERVEQAVLDLAEETGIWLVDRVIAMPIAGLCQIELTAGTGTFDFSAAEIRSLFEQLLRRIA